MIDIHCHILPDVDDGATDRDVSIAMAAMAVADGIHTVIASPHVGTGMELSMVMIEDAVENLNKVLRERGIPLYVLPGAEVKSHAALNVADQFCLASGSFFLLEFSHSHLPADCLDLVYALVARGLTPIIAHPERNRAIFSKPQKLLSLIEAGAKVQVTASSLTGGFGPNISACAQFLLKNNMVHFLASDAHSPDFRRPILSQAVKRAKKYLGKKRALALVVDNPLDILPAGCQLH